VKTTALPLPEALLVEPRVFRDDRGFFFEWFNDERFQEHGLPTAFRQVNQSRSKKGVLRGLHFQNPRAQGKLVMVTRGAVFDVIVDIRVGSPTFGKWCGATLTEDEQKMLWVPAGFAHGFYTLSDVADFVYLCTDVYVPSADRAVRWSDPSIGIEWPDAEPLLSPKDRDAPLLSEVGDQLPRFDNG
jgi:dTDP-4-dehydrorhamnose 3,5-epimerase